MKSLNIEISNILFTHGLIEEGCDWPEDEIEKAIREHDKDKNSVIIKRIMNITEPGERVPASYASQQVY